MNFKTLTEGDRAVSPVIGIILMVAITVILAAVIGTFVLGLGDSVTGETAPQASWDVSNTGDGGVEVAHNGGDSVEEGNIQVNVNGQNVSDSSASFSDSFTDGESISAGSSATITGVSDGDEISVVWNAPDSDSSQELTSYEYTG